MLKVFLCLRYLRKKKIVLLSVVAVALSVALLISADSLLIGFIEGLKEAYVWGEGDVTLYTGKALARYDTLIDALERIPGVDYAHPYLGGGGLLRLGSGDVRETGIMGIDVRYSGEWDNLKKSLLGYGGSEGELSFDVPGYPDDVGGWVGIGLVAVPDEKTDEYDLESARELIGRRVLLMTSGQTGAPDEDANGVESAVAGHRYKRKVLAFRIADIVHSGLYSWDNAVYLPYRRLYSLRFGDVDEICVLSVGMTLGDGAEPASVRDAVRRVWERFAADELGWEKEAISRAAVSTREENWDSVFGDFQKQRRVLLLVFGVICSISMLLIFCIFYLVVRTRQKDIAVIKSCGERSGSVALIFLGFGTCVGIAGSALGIGLGAAIIRNIVAIERLARVVFGLRISRSFSYISERMPNMVCWDSVFWVALVAIGVCVIGVLIPAMAAARVEPVRILRYE
ncbi:MAG: ABC transporter permease [Planctomycetota bacterium]|jgi:ABC-type lipoprotein release transport system permease subunit